MCTAKDAKARQGNPLYRRVLVLLAIPVVALPAAAQVAEQLQPNFGWVPPDDREITELGDGLSVITLSFPGNVAVLSGPDGILLVDNQMPPFDAQMVKPSPHECDRKRFDSPGARFIAFP